MKRGKFITFEGGEGAGKSTQTARLAERLRRLGHDVVITREPGGSPFAEQLRRVLLDPDTPPHAAIAETLVFCAARADHLAHVIRPALSAGQWVLCDRFTDSTRVYQGHAGDVPLAAIEALEAIVVKPTVPDLTLMIDLDPALGLERATRRREVKNGEGATADTFEARDLSYHSHIREGFLAIAHKDSDRCVVINGGRAADDVAADVLAAVEARLLTGDA